MTVRVGPNDLVAIVTLVMQQILTLLGYKVVVS